MKRTALAAGLLTAVAAPAFASDELFIDINTLTATFAGDGAFGLNATGSINLVSNANSTLAGVRINGVAQTVTSSLLSYSGRIDLVNGGVTGGFVSVTNVDGSTYSASIVNGQGDISKQSGQGFSIDGLTFNGLFGNGAFAGVDVSAWFNAQPRPGSVLTFAFNPNAQGVDVNSDVDLYVLVPAPQAAGLGFASLIGLAAGRRRR